MGAKKSSKKLPMAVIYDNMTADRFKKLETLYWRANDALSSVEARYPELEAAKLEAKVKIAAMDEAEAEDWDWDKRDEAWVPYHKVYDKLRDELFNKLCERASAKAAWNTNSLHLVGVAHHQIKSTKLSGVTTINVA